MALPVVRRSTYLALKEERDSYRLALLSIDDRLPFIWAADAASEQKLTDVANTLEIALHD